MKKSFKNIAVLMSVLIVLPVLLMGGCTQSWSRRTSISIYLYKDSNSISWTVREEVAQDISAFYVEIFFLSQYGEWLELLSEDFSERDVYTGSHEKGLWGIKTYREYSFKINEFEVRYGAYKIRNRSTNHGGRQSRWTENQQGVFIQSGQRMSTPTNLRLVGNVLHWDSEGKPDSQPFIPEHSGLPVSPIGTKKHRHYISISTYANNETIVTGTSVSASKNSVNIGSYIRRKGEISILVWTTDAVYDFVYFNQSESSEPIILNR